MKYFKAIWTGSIYSIDIVKDDGVNVTTSSGMVMSRDTSNTWIRSTFEAAKQALLEHNTMLINRVSEENKVIASNIRFNESLLRERGVNIKNLDESDVMVSPMDYLWHGKNGC